MKPIVSHAVVAALSVIVVLLLIDDNEPEAFRSRRTQSEVREVHQRSDSADVAIVHRAPRVRARGALLRRHDTLRCYDTLIHADTQAIAPDTLSLCLIRDSLITMSYASAPRQLRERVYYTRFDSVITIRDSVAVLSQEDEPWYKAPLLVIAAALVGFLLGSVR